MPNGLSNRNSLDQSIASFRVSGLVLGLLLIKAYSVDPDQTSRSLDCLDLDPTPRSAAFDLGLHGLQMSHYGTLGLNGSMSNMGKIRSHLGWQ